MNRYRFLYAILFALVLLSFGPITVFGQDKKPVSDDDVNAVASQLYCPICENVPLDVCPSQACADWRELIRGYLEQGWTADQIKDYFAAQYGWNVLNVPPPAGINWFIYIGPPLILLAGIITVVMLVKFGKKMMAANPGVELKSNEKYKELLNQVEKDLREK